MQDLPPFIHSPVR